MRVAIANLYSDQVGNPRLPKKFQALKKHSAKALGGDDSSVARARGNRRWHRNVFPLSRAIHATCTGKKHRSLAFRKPERDRSNAYFADGIQDEILSRLSKIADLKVISRTSTQHYKSAPENLPRDRQPTWRRSHPGRKCAEERRRRAGERAVDQSCQ